MGSPAVLEMSFDLENARFGRRAAAEHPVENPVFVCGLARAGTTIILRILHETGEFDSLSYRDLPFPLAPNSAEQIFGRFRRGVAAREREHGDGLTHDLDSPEAIEEIFWRCFEGKRFLRPEGLAPVPPSPETVEQFRRYMSLVLLRYGHGRYLSKNNANILRLPALIEAAPTAILIHPFRDPLQQAASLLNQHVRALALHRSDPFRLRFMTWLGHHEFGGGQRPFLLPGGPDSSLDPMTLDYWLATWTSVYASLLDQPPAVRARQHFLDYDAMCAAPIPGATALAAAAGVGADSAIGAELRAPPLHLVGEASAVRVDAASAMLDLLKRRAIG
jgi:hypothetical protein